SELPVHDTSLAFPRAVASYNPRMRTRVFSYLGMGLLCALMTAQSAVALWINVSRELRVPRGVFWVADRRLNAIFSFYRTDKIRSPPKKIETIPRKAGATLLDTRSFSLDDLVFAIQLRSEERCVHCNTSFSTLWSKANRIGLEVPMSTAVQR